ncbi:hypothetical protein AVEN_49450-1 [Araneus ventricosus]|uniref:Uncharacterized protein n=1 Tax=Araneus ventricosus TaxID=182803 RepID=A0A4Y2CS16_ARAVE|nr:hypothetical protein AVEN_49450-1 [Araneus ventricosus]
MDRNISDMFLVEICVRLHSNEERVKPLSVLLDPARVNRFGEYWKCYSEAGECFRDVPDPLFWPTHSGLLGSTAGLPFSVVETMCCYE